LQTKHYRHSPQKRKMMDDEKRGLVDDDHTRLPTSMVGSGVLLPSKRRRYAYAAACFFGFIFLLSLAVMFGKTDRNGVEDIIAGDLGEDDKLMEGRSEDDEDEQHEYNLGYFVKRCEGLRAKNYPKGSIEYEIAAADCGWGYDFNNSTGKYKKWKVYLFGTGWANGIIEYSGCPVQMRCPLSPRCEIDRAHDPSKMGDADVVVIFQNDVNQWFHQIPTLGHKVWKVLYDREAKFFQPNRKTQFQFDFEMGVHYHSGLLNPNFLRTPSEYLSGAIHPFPPLPFVPFEKRKFAMSIISDCSTGSHREIYINMLAHKLGVEKVHRFGSCGDRVLPPKPINNAAKLMSEYKYYLAFENTIQEGYITEKLFFVLNIPVVPIYYGALNAPNVTKVPSYIRVNDFATPKELAAYLMHLEDHPEEYMRYHAWRKDPNLFDPAFLRTLQTKSSGPEEQMRHRKRFKRFPRTAQCCRLCDESYVKFAASTRDESKALVTTMGRTEIDNRYFGGRMDKV
jgi:hypothetical protein